MAEQTDVKEAALAWTEDRVELLRKLWLEGLSASRIAVEIAGGVSRNAVIGKVHRLGLSGRAKIQTAMPRRSRPDRASAPETSETPQRAVAMSMHESGDLAIQSLPIAITEPRRTTGGYVVTLGDNVTIMDLRESMCRWPVGDPSSPDFRYCGGRAPIGDGPYCSVHSRLAYQPTQDRRARKFTGAFSCA